jgi:hypothetical protein
MENKINKLVWRQNIIFFLLLLILSLQVVMFNTNRDHINQIENKVDSIEVRLDSINNEMIMLNQYLYD